MRKHSSLTQSILFKHAGRYSIFRDLLFMVVVGLMITSYFLVVNVFAGSSLSFQTRELTSNIMFSVCISILLYGMFRVMFRYLNTSHPWNKSIVGRILREIPLVFLISASGMCLFMVVWAAIFKERPYLKSEFVLNIATASIVSFLLNAFYETANLFRQLQDSKLEAERLRRKSVESHFETLKNQVGPHFLFNSLNTLLALMDENIPQAKLFVEKLASYYRYALQVNEQDLVELKTEMKLVLDYMYLLQCRFDENLHLELDEDLKKDPRKLIPLSVQMLVENAVKHNVISSSKPLRIKIYMEGDLLIVENNRQHKTATESSNGIGLGNIGSRYHLVIGRDIHVTQTDAFFRVELPLIH